MSFYIVDTLTTSGNPPRPEKQKEGVISFAYVSGTNDDISYLQLLGSNTIWVTGLATAGTDNLYLPSDANMIQLFDQNQVLVGCSRHINLYVNARCTINAVTPATIVLPVAGMYDLDLTVVSSTAVYVSCQQISGGPEATSGNLVAPLNRNITGAFDVSNLVPPYGSCDLILVQTGDITFPSATTIYTTLYGTQTFQDGMSLTFKFLSNGGAIAWPLDITVSAFFPLGFAANNTMYLITLNFTTNALATVSGILIGATAV